jgi:predicted PhzF superfamily epimerase YddE/YHI9
MRIRIIDAFTDRPFAGNPAGVCLLAAGSWPDTQWMRRIAAELNHETAFAHPVTVLDAIPDHNAGYEGPPADRS